MLAYSAIDNRENVITIWDVSWYFYKSKKIQFFMQKSDKKESQTNKTCIHTFCYVYAYFLIIACKSIICVSNDNNYCAFSIVNIITIVIAQ